MWKEKNIHPGAPTHTTPVLCEKKATVPLLYDSQSLRGIVTTVNQNKFFPDTFTKKILSFYKGILSRLVKSKQGRTASVTHDIRRMYIWLFLRLSLSSGQNTKIFWNRKAWYVRTAWIKPLKHRDQRGLLWNLWNVKFFKIIAISFIKMKTFQKIY